MYEDNLPRVAGVGVEIRKAKRYEDEVDSGGQGRDKEKQRIRGRLGSKKDTRLGSKKDTTTIPRQRRQKACWVF